MKFISNHIASCIRCPINHRLSSEGGEAGLDEAVVDGGGGVGGSRADAQTDMYNNYRLGRTCKHGALAGQRATAH